MYKSIITLITALVITTSSSAQSEMYFQKMGEALETFSTVETVDDFVSAAANFDLISSVEQDQWLPLYYHAQIYILVSFVDAEAEADKKDEYLDFAEKSIDKMIKIAPEESEVYALQSFLYTGRIVVDPMNRGQAYGIKSSASIQKALALDSENPRAKYMKLSGDIGRANFFGQETSQYCEEAITQLADWDNFKPKSELHPNWGKAQLVGIVADCGTTKEEAEVDSIATTEEIKTESNTTENVEVHEISKDGSALTIIIGNLPSDDGVVLVELLDEKEKSVANLTGKVVDGVSRLVIEGLPQGKYAVQYFHDANNNAEMDANAWGMPIEAYGFSNNVFGTMGPPKFEETLFDFSEDLSLSLKAK